MRFLNLLFKRETVVPTLTLAFASIVSVALVIARIVWTRDIHYGFLVWNLLLAWIPLIIALLALDHYESRTQVDESAPRPSRERSIVGRVLAKVSFLREVGRRCGSCDWRFYGLASVWLLFFPNAPYIFTDLIHLGTRFFRHFWIDMTLILLCALTGLVLGFVSLYFMQSVVARKFGRATSWLFVVVALGLSSFGVYLGRFLRLNSWDVFFRPGKIFQRIDSWADGRMVNMSSAAFLVLFATFLFVAYIMLYALTHLPRAHELKPDSMMKA
jgi:uncharacterized membrane protein